MSAGKLCRKHGISDATFYTGRSRFGGMEVSDARKLKALVEAVASCVPDLLRGRLSLQSHRAFLKKRLKVGVLFDSPRLARPSS
jgi:putative transposase